MKKLFFTKKRSFGILLCVAMLLTLLQTVAFAVAPITKYEDINSITATGNGEGNWLNGVAWTYNDPGNKMTETSKGVYEITYTGIAKGDDYEVKFVTTGNWTDNWGVDQYEKNVGLNGIAVHNGTGIRFSVPNDNSTVKLVLDLSNYDFETKTGATYLITITEPEPAPLSPVYVGGVQLQIGTKYVNDNGSLKVSDSDEYNAIVTGSDTEGYTLRVNALDVTGKTDNEPKKYKSSAIYTETNLKLVVESDSTVIGADTKTHSAGVYVAGNLTITGDGKLTATGGKATGGGSGSYGVYCNKNLTFENVKLEASGGDAKESSVGVFAASIVINGDNSEITAIGGNGSLRGSGIGSSSSIVLNGGKVIASGVKNAILSPFSTSTTGKEIKYLVGDDTFTDYNSSSVTDAKSLTVTLGEPEPVYHKVWFYTNGGRLTGGGVTEVTPNSLYTMQYKEGEGLTLPKDTLTRDDYTFAGWYQNSSFTGGAIGSIGAGSGMDFILHAKWVRNVAYVEAADDPSKTTYYGSLADAILAAQTGDKVGLLENTQSATITSGNFILDLNGCTLNSLYVHSSLDMNVKLINSGYGSGAIGSIYIFGGKTIGDLCQEGYGFKIGGAWVTDTQLSASSLVGGVKIYPLPIVKVNAGADVTELLEGYTDTVTLTAEAVMSSLPYDTVTTPVFYQWYSVKGEGENRSTTWIPGANNASYSFPTGKPAGTYRYVCVADYDGYSVESNEVTITVKSNDISGAVINLGTQGIYNGTEQSVYITSVTLGGKTLTRGVDYEIVSGDKATDVKDTTLKIQGIGAYTGTAEIIWKLEKATPSLYADFAQSVIDTLTNGVVYTGKPIRIETPLKDGKSGMGSVTTYYKASGNTSAHSAAKDSGEYSVIFEIAEGDNYKSTSLTVGTLTVHKADYTAEKLDLTVRYDKANKDVALKLPTLPEGAEYGEIRFGDAHYADGSDYGASIFPSGQKGIIDNVLYVSTNAVSESGIYADITIDVKDAKNYNDYTITVRVTCADRTTVSFSGIADNQTFVYDGTSKTPEGNLTVSDNIDVSSLEVKYEKVENGNITTISGAPTEIGSYRVTFSVPDSNEDYKGSVTYSFTIIKDESDDDHDLPLIFFQTLTFETNGGSDISSERFIMGAKVDLSDYTPTRDGYVFTGWYSDSDLTERVTTLRMNGNKTVYAGWMKEAIENPFTDIDSSDWFYEDVLYVYREGLMRGTSDDEFSPGLTTTRGMIVTILYRLEGEPEVSGECPFDDVKSGSYYENAITWAAENGIVNGYGNDSFGPDDNITREQLAAIFYRYANFRKIDTLTIADNLKAFADRDTVSDYALIPINWAVGEGLMQGSEGYLAPQGDATRAQVAAIIHRLLVK